MVYILDIMSNCSSIELGAFLVVFKRIFNFICILVPIVLIVSSSIKIISLVVNPEEKNGFKKIFNSFMAAVIVFFLPTFVNIVMNFFDNSFSIAGCWSSSNTVFQSKGYTDDSGSKRQNVLSGYSGYEKGKPKKNNGNANSGVNVTNSTSGLMTLKYNNWNYLLYVPENVDSNKPLIVFLHGNGNQGYDINKLYIDGGYAAHIKNGTKFPAYVLMPQLPSGSWTSGSNTKTLMEIIEKTVNENGIDRRRISLQGFSMGANETPYIVASHPGYFASEVIMSIQYHNSSLLSVLKDVPTRIYYGTVDPYAGGCVAMYNSLKKVNGEVEIFSYNGQGHAYLPKRVLDDTNSDVMSWILSKRRD